MEEDTQDSMEKVYDSLINEGVDTNYENSIYLGDGMYLDANGNIYEE